MANYGFYSGLRVVNNGMIIWLVVLYNHLEKWWSSSMGRMTSGLSIHVMENNKCSKPPTRYSFDGPSGTISRQWKHIHRKMIKHGSLEDKTRCFECFFRFIYTFTPSFRGYLEGLSEIINSFGLHILATTLLLGAPGEAKHPTGLWSACNGW